MANSRRLAINLVAGIVNSFGKVGIQLVMLPLMARLLGPSELGLAALAFPILSFVLLLSDAGLNNSLAREKDSNSPVWSSAFWGLLGFSIALAVFAYAASFLVAAAAKQPRLPALMIPLCFSIVLAGATVIPSALITREGQNRYGSLFDLIANVIAAIGAVYAALKGAGVWAMAVQSVVIYTVRFVLYTGFRPFRPKLEFDMRALLSHMGIGGALIGSRLVDAAGRLWENATISRHLGAASLGAYGYANQIGRFVAEAVAGAVWANLYYLSINREGAKALADYLGSQRMLAVVLLPLVALTAPLLPTFVPLLFGPKWGDSIVPMMIMLASYPFMSLGNQITALQLARGSARYMLQSTAAFTIARIVAVWLCFPMGLVVVAWVQAAINVALYLAGVVVAARLLGNSIKDHFVVIAGPVAASAIAWIAVSSLLGAAPSPLWAIAAAIVGLGVYVIALLAVDGPRTRSDISYAVNVVRGRTT